MAASINQCLKSESTHNVRFICYRVNHSIFLNSHFMSLYDDKFRQIYSGV